MILGLGKLPPNCLIRNPAGSFSFVGSVDARLGYVCKDGSAPTDEQLRKAAQFGPGLIGLRTRTYPTQEAAIAAAEAIGATVTL
jgi:hypothetical protein